MHNYEYLTPCTCVSYANTHLQMHGTSYVILHFFFLWILFDCLPKVGMSGANWIKGLK